MKRVKLDSIPDQPLRRSKRIQEKAAGNKAITHYFNVCRRAEKVKLDNHAPEKH